MLMRGKHWIVASVVLATLIAIALTRFVTTIAFLLDLSGYTGLARHLIPVPRLRVAHEDLKIPTRYGVVDARVHFSVPRSERAIVVIPGVHGAGLDEPRLARFSERLASTGFTVVTVPMPDLRAFRITSRSTDQIEDVTVWTSANRRLAPTGRVGLAGVSFAGGLAVVAAGRPGLAERLDLVVSLGGHGDLARAMHYLCTGRLPDGSIRPPHDYSLAVLTLDAAASLVPAEQVAALERALLTFLHASLDDTPEQKNATALFADAETQIATMADPARSIMTSVMRRDVATLGHLIEPLVEDLARDPALSPERSPTTRAPVFLLHGVGDNVIPSSESPLLAEYLAGQGNAHVRTLLTPAVSHVGFATSLGLLDGWRLVTFWHAVLSTRP